jgi:hypothetical protein
MASSPPGSASVCALQVIWVALVQHLSWQQTRPAPLLGCLSLRGPLGLSLGFYRAQVRRLDAAHFNCHLNCNASWGHPNMAGVLSGPAPPASPESLTISPAPHASTIPHQTAAKGSVHTRNPGWVRFRWVWARAVSSSPTRTVPLWNPRFSW